MGCNVSPYGGVLKYKETVTATVDSISARETKTFFTASKNCIVKVKPLTATTNCHFYINDTDAATLTTTNRNLDSFTSLVDREELFLSQAVDAGYGSLLLLLKPGDKLQLYSQYNTFTNVQYKIYVYEWK